MKYLSVCSGIEAATVGWHKLGWEAVGYSEIEPFPSAVLNHHFPKVKNYGDMTKFKEWDIERGTIDILVGGTPCQSYSIAGLRKGLKDPRGNLMLTYGAIADHLRPRIVVWENVPGVLSSNGGKDFGTLLGMLAELGYGFAYRILDAQYVRVESHERAVPQRRRRVFVVGYLGDWRRAAAILFESESMSRYIAPSRKTGESTSTDIAPSLTASGRGVKNTGETRGQDPIVDENISQPLGAKDNGKAIMEPIPIHDKATRHNGKTGKGSGNGIGIGNPGDPSPTLTTGDHHAVGYHTTGAGYWKESKESGTLRAREQESHENVAIQGYRVRRLTPNECARLQGFPDNWARIPWKGKPAEKCPDGPQYKAYGNSMATNVMEWLGERIDSVDNGFDSL